MILKYDKMFYFVKKFYLFVDLDFVDNFNVEYNGVINMIILWFWYMSVIVNILGIIYCVI